LFVDLLVAAHPGADVAMTNGGGLRADLPAGPLTYGRLYRAMPFDNRLAVVSLTGKHLRTLIRNNLFGGSGILSFAGIRVAATCQSGRLEVVLRDQREAVIDDDRPLKLLTSDFLASGGDGVIGRLGLPDGSIELTNFLIRDLMATELTRRGGSLSATQLFDPKRPRLTSPGRRPVACTAGR
jgi:5'-nucleotidase